eukprot:761494-Hanusia_phi.AAC.1
MSPSCRHDNENLIQEPDMQAERIRPIQCRKGSCRKMQCVLSVIDNASQVGLFSTYWGENWAEDFTYNFLFSEAVMLAY